MNLSKTFFAETYNEIYNTQNLKISFAFKKAKNT